MIACSVQAIGKMYGGNSIFEKLTFEIHENDRVGLVGRNGGGKTTLFRLLAGEEPPDSGQIHWKKDTEIGYLSQIPVFNDEMTTKDILRTAFLGLLEKEQRMKELERKMGEETNPERLQDMIEEYGVIQDQFILLGGYEMDASIEKIVNGLKMNELLSKNFSALSGGEQTKVGLALILLKSPNFLLLDEPTNHLDLMSVEWLGGFLKEYKGTVLIISHDRYFLDEVVNKILDLEDGEITGYQTNFSGFVKEKEERLLKEFQAFEEQQKKIKKMKEAIKRLREWANRANPPSEGLHKRARNMERALERMEKLDRPIINRKKMGFEIESTDRSGKDVAVLKEVSKSFNEQILFSDVMMHVQYRDRAAIIGENGTGKSTLIKIMLKQLNPDMGEVKLGSNLKIGYLSQKLFQDRKDETVIDVFRDEIKVTEGEARHLLSRFLFYGHSVFRRVSQLSGGERMRLRLAQLMHQDINLLVLDEPTNHLDIESREVLEEALEGYNGTIIAVSHDRYFLNKLFNKIYWIHDKKLHSFDGNYNWAKKKMKEKWAKQKESHLIIKEEKPAKTEKNHFIKTEVMWDQFEKKLEELEKLLKEINIQLLKEVELEKIQSLYTQKEVLELEREDIYLQLESLG
ncbi:ribosomal protection-like ABC-F family protein [Bacillus massilinigeriensis]|uniref:ribosomal protection-like ABC-F family protein n=1 Tax=Bacillus massilionigeriensis TaxID=1805475 RepID=UPI00096B487E|nr:ABC-F type ribosomal protection protein [Bacillus massilionigeriensis]